jgi:pyruvate,water dikinase
MIRRVLSFLGRWGRGMPERRRLAGRHEIVFKVMYEKFREILALNDSTLEVIADIEDRLASRRPFSMDATARRVRKAAMDVFLMVRNLNQIADNRHTALYDALRHLDVRIEVELTPAEEKGSGRLVIPIEQLRAADAPSAGSKMANLGEIAASLGLRVPDGFAISTDSFRRFMWEGELWDPCGKLESCLEEENPGAFAEACRQMQAAVLSTPMAEDLAQAIVGAFEQHFPEPGTLVAVRSSAVGEDTAAASHAGLYTTKLNVDRQKLLEAYRSVLASAFSPTAVSYHYRRGITTRDAPMAVGCVRMIRPRCAGILYSRLPDDPNADAVVITATRGLAASVVAGEQQAETVVLTAGLPPSGGSTVLTPSELGELSRAARRIEEHFESPQDIEWAVDTNGSLWIIQARPLVEVPEEDRPEGVASDRPPLLAGGAIACPGVGAGLVFRVSTDDDLERFPKGAVLVARHSSPAFAQVMNRCAAIVTDIGSQTGHMSSLAREFHVPAIVGLEGATHALQAGQPVTVDARAGRVFEGILAPEASSERDLECPPDSPAFERLRRVGRHITRLTLIDPASPSFAPDHCQSLHDITRFVHEKVFEVMFHYGDVTGADRTDCLQLQAKLPIKVEVYDVGGGITEGATRGGKVRPEHIISVPMGAFLSGLLEPNIRWDLPRPVSLGGFLSVIGESVAGPPHEAIEIGRMSYAIISDRYMNFSTKAGYHFSTVDTYCGKSVNKNYIHFRFNGGGADPDRRQRRVAFLSGVLQALDFKVQTRSDLLVARLDKYGSEDILSRLVSLGQLTLCARQLDMLMDSDLRAEQFTQAFLARDWAKF